MHSNECYLQSFIKDNFPLFFQTGNDRSPLFGSKVFSKSPDETQQFDTRNKNIASLGAKIGLREWIRH